MPVSDCTVAFVNPLAYYSFSAVPLWPAPAATEIPPPARGFPCCKAAPLRAERVKTLQLPRKQKTARCVAEPELRFGRLGAAWQWLGHVGAIAAGWEQLDGCAKVGAAATCPLPSARRLPLQDFGVQARSFSSLLELAGAWSYQNRS